MGLCGFKLPAGRGEAYSASNNLARLDILQCLRWVRENIAAFGGDPDTVTRFGQSAGSANITGLLLTPQAHGSFRRVICESSFAMDISLTSREDSAAISRELFARMGASTLEEALGLPPEVLLNAQNDIVRRSMGGSPAFEKIPSKLFSPVMDGEVIPLDYWSWLEKQGCRGIDFLGGTNAGKYDQQFAGFAQDPEGARARVLSHCRKHLAGRESLVDEYRGGRSEVDACRQ